MNVSQKSFQLARMGVRRFVSSPRTLKEAKGEVPLGYTKIKAKMEKFQVDDGVPVHLKGGTFDKILYQTTLILSVVGIACSFHTFYTLAYPKSS